MFIISPSWFIVVFIPISSLEYHCTNMLSASGMYVKGVEGEQMVLIRWECNQVFDSENS